ncbi:hypothetical protein Tco_1354897 [Tanacetum coccineum]
MRDEKKLSVIEQPISPAPPTDSTAQVLTQWNAVYDVHNEVACLMLESMTPKLHGKLENSTPYEMLQELKSMFDKQAGGYVEQLELLGKTIGELHALLIEDEKGLPKKAATPQVMEIQGGRIQKANKKSFNAKGKGKGNDKSYIPKPKNPKPYAKEHPTKDDACHNYKETATRTLNMVSTKKVDKTPYKFWYGKVPYLSYLKIWGCEALVKRDTPDKLQKRSVKCIFIGYPKETMGYYFYFPPENKIVVARYAEFLEKNLLSQEINGRAEELEEIQDEDTSPYENTSKIPMEV